MKLTIIPKIILCIFLALASVQISQAQFGKLKDKLKKKNPVKKKSSTSSSKGVIPKANLANKIGQEKIAEMKAYYKVKYYAVRNFPPASNISNGLLIDDCSKTNSYQIMFETADWANLQKRMADEKSKYPALFKYYGMEDKNQRYADMAYGGQTSTMPFQDKDLKSINNYIKSIYEWRAKVQKSQKGLAMTVQNLLNKTENEVKVRQFDCTVNTIKMAKAIKSIDPENPMIDEMIKEAQAKYDQNISQIAHLMTGDFHKQHIKEAVVFNKKQTIGKENPSDLTNTITPGVPAFIAGYFASTNKDGGGVPSLTWVMVNEQTPADKAATKYQADFTQAMYRNFEKEKVINKQAYMTFELFPDPASINYESHLAYLPHLNFAKWVTMQMPGTYQMVFRWGKTNIMAISKVVTMTITPENKAKAKAYYETLMQKKIKAVTFPGGCADKRSSVTNIEDLSKYGKLLKINMGASGNIMKPWPNDDQVDWNTATGWGAFEKDGKVEVINLEFRKRPTAVNWKWWSIGMMSSGYALEGKIDIKPEKLNFGYEMTKEKVNTCKDW